MNVEFFKGKSIALFLNGGKKFLNIVIIVVTLFVSLIIHSAQNKNFASIRDKRDEEQKKNNVLNEIIASEKRIKSLSETLGKKDESIIKDVINSIAKDSGVRLLSINAGKEEGRPLYIKYPFILVIEADSYHAIGRFISKIENQPNAYFINEMNISLGEPQMQEKESSGVTEKKSKLIVNLTLSIIGFKG